MNILYEILTFAEATKLWDLNPSTLRKAITYSNRLKEGEDYRKSANTWLIKKESMERAYGKLKQK